MERLVSVSRNIFAQKVEGNSDPTEPPYQPLVELVLVTIEHEYKPHMQKPLIEGGQPQFGLAKVPVTKTIRFLVDPEGLAVLVRTVSGAVSELTGDTEEENLLGPSYHIPNEAQAPVGPSVIVP